MTKRELAEKLTSFCAEYRLLGNPKRVLKAIDRVEQELDNICFVESVIHMLCLKTKYIDVDNVRLKDLLMELEKVRLDLEYDEHGYRGLKYSR